MSELTILYPIRKSPDWLVFMSAVCLGAQNFNSFLIERAQLRGAQTEGITTTWRNANVGEPLRYDVEAFAPSRERLMRVMAEALIRYPWRAFETRFGPIEEMFDGFRARGSRLQERDPFAPAEIQFAQAAE